ncbi:MAG: ribonuclease HI [Thermodesulfobacteriota bacterium]
MAKKKFYAVSRGRKPGIYLSWPEAESQVKGFGGAKFKGFPSRSEAEAWMKDPVQPPPGRKRSVGKTKQVLPKITADCIEIYTDGGAIGNPGPGGYGVVLIVNGERSELSGGYRHTTNNRMELMACIKGIEALPTREQKVALFSDSSYVVNGISKGWAKGWRRRGWLKSDGKEAVNPDLWGRLLDLTQGLDISFHWVKGHAGHPENERCDKLAVASARGGNLVEDEGYSP